MQLTLINEIVFGFLLALWRGDRAWFRRRHGLLLAVLEDLESGFNLIRNFVVDNAFVLD